MQKRSDQYHFSAMMAFFAICAIFLLIVPIRYVIASAIIAFTISYFRSEYKSRRP